MKHSFILLIITLGFLHNETLGQGCSDAGFCTMGAMRPNQGYSKKVNLRVRSVELNQYYGLTTFFLQILAYNADVNIGITDRLTAQIKLPYQFVSGKLANTQGLGDISISLTQNLISKEAFRINLSFGAKIPTGNSNITTNVADTNGVFADRPLPMYYQTSLGTYDVIGGVSLSTKNWLFSTGIQIPLNKNGNQFLWGAWNNTDKAGAAQKYAKSRELQRGTDVMLRIERNFRFSNWNTFIGLLSIYRINKDKFLDVPLTDGVVTEISTTNRVFGRDIHTDNFAISLLAGGGYRFNTKVAVKLMVGYRLVDRTSTQGKNFAVVKNPDGLARLLVTNVGFEYRF